MPSQEYVGIPIISKGFTASIEEAKAAEKELKERAAKQKQLDNAEKEARTQAKKQKREEKFRSDMALARQKVGVGLGSILSEHVVFLNGAQVDAVAFCQLGIRLKGTVPQRRGELQRLLSVPNPSEI